MFLQEVVTRKVRLHQGQSYLFFEEGAIKLP